MTTTLADTARVLLVEDDTSFGNLLRDEVEDMGLAVRLVNTAEEAVVTATEWMPDLIISDLRLPGADGLALLDRVKREIPEGTPDVLMITAFGTVAKAVESLKAGAEDFLTKPLDFEHLELTVRRILEKRGLRNEIKHMRTLLASDAAFHGMYGRSRPMLKVFQQIRQLAKADGPVLIMGESGTGKELVAQAIHREAQRAASPFLAVNCAGIPEHLLESEFFGHEAGAFTGAGKARQGLFAEAQGGTLLLDEISEMPLALQAKLLRMLQDGKIRPVGSNREQQVDVRIIAATNQDIEMQVRNGTFREDLFYRLETFPLHVPPLRERDDDVDLLAGIFLAKYACAAGKRINGFSQCAIDLLRTYSFPGNVRELQNAVERAVVYCQDSEIDPMHLPARMQKTAGHAMNAARKKLLESLDINEESLVPLDVLERRYIQHVVDKVNGNKRLAASILGIARCTLYRRLDES